MSSFSHLSASHNSNNGNPKKHWRAPAWGDSAIWEAARRFAGTTHRRIRRRRAPPGNWCCGRAQSPGPRDRSLETSVLGLRKSPSVHCSKPTAPLAYGWCRRKHHVFSASAVPKSRCGSRGFGTRALHARRTATDFPAYFRGRRLAGPLPMQRPVLPASGWCVTRSEGVLLSKRSQYSAHSPKG